MSIFILISSLIICSIWRVWRYQRCNQNLYIEEEQTTQWPKEKVQKDKQRSTKHTYKTKDRLTRTPIKTGGEIRCSGRVSSSCSTSGTHRVNLVTNPVISREWGKDREVCTTSGTYLWSFVTQIFHNGKPSYGGDHKIFEVMTSTLPKGTLGIVASLLAATLYYGNPDRNHKLWNIVPVSSERYILHMQVLMECCYIKMESSQWENLNHLFCRKVSFLTDPHCRFRGLGQGMYEGDLSVSVVSFISSSMG